MTEPPTSTVIATGGVLSWLPWLGVVLIGGAVGAVLGVTGVFGNPTETVVESSLLSITGDGADAASCPGGQPLVHLSGGQGVFALLRTDDSGYIGIRNPADVGTTVWVSRDRLVGDDFSTLPVGGCGAVAIAAEPVADAPVVPGTPVTPGKPQPPAPPPADTAAPTVGAPTVSPNPLSSCGGAQSATVSVTASDNVGVSGVSISWSGTTPSSGQMSPSGGSWQYAFTPAAGANGNATFTVQARDAAGNLSGTATTAKLNYNCVG